MRRFAAFLPFLLLSLVACDGTTPTDAGVVDDDAGVDAGVTPAYVEAADYCESIAPFFCAYYMRCNRMAGVDDVATCEETFLSSCNDGYEQRYVDLAEAGLTQLSSSGIDACAAHLDDVACEEQIRDLDGPCALMWEGTSPEGSACGLDVEGFVCQPGTACVLDLSFCGTCEAGGVVDDTCETGLDCLGELQCVDGVCRERALPGQACDDDVRCVVGAVCDANVCVGPTVVQPGGGCDQRNRCAYKSACIGGVCVELPLVGESCDAAQGCASGFCSVGTCTARQDAGTTCSSHDQCRSRQCIDDVCTPLPGGCLQ